MTPDKTPSDALTPCPFCGAGETQIHVNKGTWRGHGYGEPVSVEVRHWCADVPGQPSRMISRAGRDEVSAIAAWNTRAKWGSPVVAGEPVAELVVDRFTTQLKALSAANDVRPYGAHRLYTNPQPTQAQAGAVPLTDAQADSIAMAAFEKHCGRPHPWEGAQPWVIAAIKAAHGINGKTK